MKSIAPPPTDAERRKSILIADDDEGMLNVLKLRCEQLGLHTYLARDARTALNTAADVSPDMICIDVQLPGGNGLALAEMLLSDEQFAATPLIIVTGQQSPEVERRCHQLPAYYIPKSATTWSRLRPLIAEMLAPTATDGHNLSAQLDQLEEKHVPMPTQSSTPTDWAVDSQTQDLMDSVFALMGECQKSLDQIIDQSQPWLLCIDDDRDFSAALASRLRRYGIGVLNAFDGADGYRQAFLQPAAAIILDYNMPNGQGDYVLRRLQETPITKDIPVIVLTGNRDTTIRRTMLNLGASAFLFKPPQFEKLLEELARFVKLAPIDEPAPTP